jgi:Family of unknown function (DUF5763)
MDRQCKAKNAAGKPCSAQARPSGYCQWHDPALKDERAAWRREGVKARSNRSRAKRQLPDEPMNPDELAAYLTLTFKATLSGKLAPNIANALGNLARSMLQVRESTTLEERLAALEAAAGIGERRIS